MMVVSEKCRRAVVASFAAKWHQLDLQIYLILFFGCEKKKIDSCSSRDLLDPHHHKKHSLLSPKGTPS